jgi:hypothetical protein
LTLVTARGTLASAQGTLVSAQGTLSNTGNLTRPNSAQLQQLDARLQEVSRAARWCACSPITSSGIPRRSFVGSKGDRIEGGPHRAIANDRICRGRNGWLRYFEAGALLHSRSNGDHERWGVDARRGRSGTSLDSRRG